MDNDLKDKNVILVAPTYFDYEKDIIQELREIGANVFFIQENIDSSDFKQKVINKLPGICRKFLRRSYFKRKLRELRHIKIDYFFGIRINHFDREIMKCARDCFPNARFICYFWDSVKNMNNPLEITVFFDSIYTFDETDYMNNISQGWKFLPLFYTENFKDIKKNKIKKYDILYISSLSLERAKIFLELRDHCKKHSLNLYTFFYCKRYLFYYYCFFHKIYRLLPLDIIHNEPLSRSQVLDLMSQSRAVFDFTHSTQSGLTMRTIECLGAGIKLITSNMRIKKYNFYNQNNIFIIDNTNKIKDIGKFIVGNNYIYINEDIFNSYSLKSWIKVMFNEK